MGGVCFRRKRPSGNPYPEIQRSRIAGCDRPLDCFQRRRAVSTMACRRQGEYYWSNNKVMAADIRTTGNGIETGIPHELFPLDSPFYCPARDGRFVVLKPVESATITVVTNWTELVRQ